MAYITLLSDFGLLDASVASAKGILIQEVPGANIIDITHLATPFYMQQAAYIFAAAYPFFPKGSHHILLFDIYSEKTPQLMLFEYEGSYFFAPNNGILSLVFGSNCSEAMQCYDLQPDHPFSKWIKQTGTIIQNIEINGKKALNYPTVTIKSIPRHFLPKVSEKSVECHVVHIDRYENVVINIKKEEFERIANGRKFSIQFMRNDEITEISTRYNSVREGEKLCRFNTAGYMEIAINRGNAASLLGFKLHKGYDMMYNTVKIFFE